MTNAYIVDLDFFDEPTGQCEVRAYADNPHGYVVLGTVDNRTAAEVAVAAVAALAARGITSHEAMAQVVASAAAGCAAAEAEARRGPVDDTAIPDLMSVTEVAAHHEVSRAAVKKAIARGALPARKVGSTYVIRRAVVEAAGQTILIESPGE